VREGISWRLALLAVLLAASCTEATPTSSTAPSQTEAPRRGGQVVLGLSADITTLQPILSIDTNSDNVLSLIYAPMLTLDPATGALAPGLAERFVTSADGKQITYTMRAGLVWSDATPLTGEDYLYTVEAIARSKKTAIKSYFQDIVGWDDYVTGREATLRGLQILNSGRTVQIDLRRGHCSAMSDMSWIRLIPRDRFVRFWDPATRDTTTSIDSAAINKAPPVASGPFKFVEYKPLEGITLARNERYYKGAPLLDGVVFRIFDSAVSLRTAFLAGELTTGPNIAPQDVEDTRQRMGSSATDFTVSGASGFTILGFNQKSTTAPWLADKNVRKALWYGLDIETMIRAIYLGYAHRIFAYTPQISWAYDATGLEHYDFDLKRARSLLESAGATLGSDGYYRWRDGRTMTLRIEIGNNMAARQTFVEAAQEQYRTLGIKVDLGIQPFAGLATRLNQHDPTLEGYVFSSGVGPDNTDSYESWHSSQSSKGLNSGFSDPELDRAVDAGMFGPDCSVAARRAAYHQMDRIVNEAVPVIFLYYADQINFRSSKLVAGPPLPYGSRYDIEKWWLRQ
jgi:peptide/nickel transport system substrate-binding protein